MRRGEMRELGRHRVMCGDASNPEDVARLVGDDSVDCLLTSPPYLNLRVYGVNKTPVTNWQLLVTQACCLPRMQAHGQMLVVLGLVHNKGEWSDYWSPWLDDMRRNGWRRFGFYIWNRKNYLPGDWSGRLPTQFEMIFHLNRRALKNAKTVPCVTTTGLSRFRKGTIKRDGTHRGVWQWGVRESPMKAQGSVIDCHPVKTRRYAHSAQMPSKMNQTLLSSWQWPNPPVIYDPFAGTGNVCIAAQEVGGRALMMEKEPEYCEMIVRRYREECG